MEGSILKSVVETANTLGISEVTMRRLIKAKKISYRKIGDRYLFAQNDIDDYIASVRVPAVSYREGAFNA
jgi:excisionase family DNA binding protein